MKKAFNSYVKYGVKLKLHSYDSIIERKKEKEFWINYGKNVGNNFKIKDKYCFYSY